jgi:hypothetical protein
MNNATPPQEFLVAFDAIDSLMLDALSSKKKPQWRWEDYYPFYLELDWVTGQIARLGQLLSAADECSVGKPTQAWRGRVNAVLEALGTRHKALLGWLARMCRSTLPQPGDSIPHDRLYAHVHPKSGWYQVWIDTCFPWQICAVGTTLEACALPIDQTSTRTHVSRIDAEALVRRQRFDIGTADARIALGQDIQRAEVCVRATARRLQTCLVENCVLDDLLVNLRQNSGGNGNVL